MRIVADKDVCIGSGQCVLTDPEVFDQDEDDALVVVLVEHPVDLDKAREAVQLCPSQALSLVED
ncbi:MAG TPA: (4Fe-4S)-binding protein [Amycolatopsis sp.]|nr:(4Fe-4S)-binding protein [Amycolatopsis sp.]